MGKLIFIRLKHLKTITSYIAGILTSLIVIATSAEVFASVNYMDADPNYPATYYHVNYREYVDLSSCDWNDTNDDYDVYSTGYIACTLTPEGESRKYLTRSFRQVKDKSEPPQFYDGKTQEWIAIPVYDRNEIQRYKAFNGYLGYIEHYHAFEYFMFKTVYRENRGEEYPDNLEGDVP